MSKSMSGKVEKGGTKRAAGTPAGWVRMLRTAIRKDARTVYAIARDARMHVAILQRFDSGERTGINIVTAEKLATALGLELRPMREE